MSELIEEKVFSKEDATYMQMAIDLAVDNVGQGGGPFGAVIVSGGKVLATGTNRVVPTCDPTAHAEVSAIRVACQKVKAFKLEDATIYSSCEPCPMCLSAIYWAGIRRLCYGATKHDAKAINFDDSFIYDQLTLPYKDRSLECHHIMHAEALIPFRTWTEKEDKVEY